MIQKLEQEFLVLVHDQQKNISKRTFFFFIGIAHFWFSSSENKWYLI